MKDGGQDTNHVHLIHNMSVFLDIDIGDAKQHTKEVDAYKLSSAFFDQVGPQVWDQPD